MEWVVLQGYPKSVDGIERRRCNVIEGSPVIGNEVPRLQSLEQCERIAAGEMSFSKSGLPPWRVANGQQREIQVSPLVHQMPLHQMRRIRSQRCITCKETGDLISIYKVHISLASPPVDTVPVSFMRSCCSLDADAIELCIVSRSYWNCVRVALLR